MGMQAQSASHPPPPPLPPPPSCSAQLRSQGSLPARRLSRAAGCSRRARPRLFPAVPEAHRAAATELSSITHHSIPPSLPHLHTEKDTGQGCCRIRAPSREKPEKLELGLYSMAWKRAIQANTQRNKHSLSPTHTPQQTSRRANMISSLLCCEPKTRLQRMKQQKKKKELFFSSLCPLHRDTRLNLDCCCIPIPPSHLSSRAVRPLSLSLSL